MTSETPNQEPSIETPEAPMLTSAAEVFLSNPLTSTTERDDGSIERKLSTAKVDDASLDRLSGPIELTSVTVDGKTSYTLERWDGLHLHRSTWSSDPTEAITSVAPDKTGLLVPRPNDTSEILSDLKYGSERFELSTNSQPTTKSRIKLVLGKLGNRRAA